MYIMYNNVNFRFDYTVDVSNPSSSTLNTIQFTITNLITLLNIIVNTKSYSTNFIFVLNMVREFYIDKRGNYKNDIPNEYNVSRDVTPADDDYDDLPF